MEIEEGKYYRTADGWKVGPAERTKAGYPWLIPLYGNHLYYRDDGTLCTDNDDWRIVAEWGEYKTLRELDVKPGDVVEHRGGYKKTVADGHTTEHCRMSDEGGWVWDAPNWRIVSRAEADTLIDTLSDDDWNDPELAEVKMIVGALRNDTPTLWRDMTPEQKGALLLARHEGKVIEAHDGDVWFLTQYPAWHDDTAYRIRPEPVLLTVTLHGAGYEWTQADLPCDDDTHRITFDLLDGEPVLDSIKMEKL